MTTPFSALPRVSAAMTATRSRKAKVQALVDLLAELAPEEVASAVGWLSAEPPCGPLGLGPVNLHALCNEMPAPGSVPLAIAEVDAALVAMQGKRGETLLEDARALFLRLSEEEQLFVARAMTGSLRQGGLAGIVMQAIAAAAGVKEEDVRRVAMVSGKAARAAEAFLGAGKGTAPHTAITLFSPVAPMLASSAENVDEAIEGIPHPRVEWKVDGVRAQIHKSGAAWKVYSRQGNDITASCARVPELAELRGESLVLDAEVVLVEEDGTPRPFQETFSALSAGDSRRLRVYAFDCLHRDGKDLIDEPLSVRAAALRECVPAEMVMPYLENASKEEIDGFFRDARARGHEGVMVKDLASHYRLGARGDAWRKWKEVTTVDLVILAVEWGSGRRKGWLSNLHLGARREDGTFAMVGKTFKGLTDEMLAFQTKRLQELATETTDWVVKVRPELVVEIAFNDVQKSPRYPGGIALRFARVVRYREDKAASEIDTLASLVARLPKEPPKKQLGLFD